MSAPLIPAALNGRQRRHLRSLAPALEPILVVGKEGVTDAVIHALIECFNRRELVKVKMREADPGARKTIAEELAGRCELHLVQVLGRTAVFYRAAPKSSLIKDRIVLPGPAGARQHASD